MKKDYLGSLEYRTYERGIMLLEKIIAGSKNRSNSNITFSYGKDGTEKRVLDVGCSSGVFLDMMRNKGWDVSGVDLCKEFTRTAQELFGLKNIFNVTLQEVGFENNKFDLITMWDMIEHVPDPISLLNETVRILKPGGTVLILTPDENSLIKYLTGLSYRMTLGHFKLPISVVYDEHHLFYFNGRSLNYALENCGLKPIARIKESTVIDRIVGPDSDHWLKKNKPLITIIKFVFFLSNISGLKNKMLVIAQKNSRDLY